MNDILSKFLSYINFKFSKQTIREFKDNPLKDTFLGLSDALLCLGIKTEGFKISNINELSTVRTPFITIKDEKFVIVTNVAKTFISYSIGKREFIEDNQTFSQNWSNTILSISDILYTQEPNYKTHKRYEMKLKCINLTSLLLCIIALCLFGYVSGFLNSPESIVLLLLNIFGLFFSALLYLEYLDIELNTTNKICNIVKNSDCNKVSNSSGSKLFNLFHLSEIGCAYFLVNICAILIFNINPVFMSIISILSLVFCIWSPLYQLLYIKKWCTLCLLTVVILITQFFYLLFSGAISKNLIPQLSIISTNPLISLILCYSIAISGFFYFTRLYNHYIRSQFQINDYKNIKYKKDVFNLLLTSESKLSNTPQNSLIFGNPNSKYSIIVISNPFCISCIANHIKMNKLPLQEYRVEYVLSSFSEDLLFANQNIIAYYKKFGADSTWELLTKWFEDKEKKPSFFNEFNLNILDCKEDVLQQLAWITEENITSSPSIYINNYKLPSQYDISDIKYF